MSIQYPIKADTEIYIGIGSYNSSIDDRDDIGTTNGSGSITRLGANLGFDYYFNKRWSLQSKLNYA